MATKVYDVYVQRCWGYNKESVNSYQIYTDRPLILEDEGNFKALLPEGFNYVSWSGFGYWECYIDPRYNSFELNDELLRNITKAGLTTNLDKINRKSMVVAK
jgi:hypothetical protein